MSLAPSFLGAGVIDIARLEASSNRLLALTSSVSRRRLAVHCRRVTLRRGAILIEANVQSEDVYFIEDGIASVVRPYTLAGKIEICLIGRESFTGSSLILGAERSPYQTFVQTDELVAIAVEATALTREMERDTSFRAILLRAVQVQMVQIAEGLVSGVWQPLPVRLARWLLMYRDRLGRDRLDLTHEFIAYMVGAQRTGITTALHRLEGDGFITAGRGVVTIHNLKALHALAGESYGTTESEQTRLLGALEP